MSFITSAFLISNNAGGSKDQKEEEQDHSLLFSFTPTSDAKSSTTTLKGLGLAVRGVLVAICGEKTRILRLRQQNHDVEVITVFCHLQVCMVMLALPGWLPDPTACSLVLQLTQSMILLAGPSSFWVEQHQEPGGAGYVKIKAPLQALFSRLCDGILKQVGAPGWSRGLPACVMQPGVMCLQLAADRQMDLEAMMRAHEAGGLMGPAMQTPAYGMQMQYNFYCRSCCLMYRGLTVWSGLTPMDTRLTWQLCWALGAHSQPRALPCQVTMHRAYPTVPSMDAAAVDSGPGAASEHADAMGQSQPSSLLILVSACHMVLAVVLTAYDEDIEELAGQVEAHAAVELLAKVHNHFTLDFVQAAGASALLTALSWPDTEPAATGSTVSSPKSAKSRPAGAHDSLFMRILSRSRPGRSSHEDQDRSAIGSPSGRSSSRPQLATDTSVRSSHPPTSPADHGSAHRARASSPLSSPLRSQLPPRSPPPAAPPTSGVPSSPPEAAASTGDNITPKRGLKISVPEPGAGPSPFQSPSGDHSNHPRDSRGTPAGAQHTSRDWSLVASPTRGPTSVNTTTTHAVIYFDVEAGRITISGDIPHVSMMPGVWSTISLCRAMFNNGSVPVSAPPKHSRLCMTIQQMEQLSATRSQREGGQRLGSADAAPWQYHPEVAGLATTQQVTRKLESCKQWLGPYAPAWFVSALKRPDGHEVFVIHSDEVDESAILCNFSYGGLPAPRNPSTPTLLQQAVAGTSVRKPAAARPLVLV